ncbi:Uncharacterised protein [Legionella pneumophila]|nr:Uncharacterised protein [Legionella pneumophila]
MMSAPSLMCCDKANKGLTVNPSVVSNKCVLSSSKSDERVNASGNCLIISKIPIEHSKP